MAVSKKIRTIDKRTQKSKIQYVSDRQTFKTSALSSENVDKYEFLTDKNVLPEIDLLEEAAIIKRFEYSPLGSELKTEIVKYQYKFFKDQINVDNNHREDDAKTENDDNRVDVISAEDNITKEFDAILRDTMNNGRSTKSISVKSNINLRPLIVKLLNAEKTVLQKEYGFDEGF